MSKPTAELPVVAPTQQVIPLLLHKKVLQSVFISVAQESLWCMVDSWAGTRTLVYTSIKAQVHSTWAAEIIYLICSHTSSILISGNTLETGETNHSLQATAGAKAAACCQTRRNTIFYAILEKCLDAAAAAAAAGSTSRQYQINQNLQSSCKRRVWMTAELREYLHQSLMMYTDPEA